MVRVCIEGSKKKEAKGGLELYEQMNKIQINIASKSCEKS